MCVCAGSLTERKSRFTSCVPPELSGPQEYGFKHFAGSVQMDRSPGRIGFMSTQRRENRWQRTSCTGGEVPSRHRMPIGGERAGSIMVMVPGPITQLEANASGGTAPPGFPAWFHFNDRFLSLGAPVWLATNSLQWDCLRVQFVSFAGQLCRDKRRGSPPFGAAPSAETCTPATIESSSSLISFPSGLAHLHPALPLVPAGKRRWAERYDGKRDLYLQHAA